MVHTYTASVRAGNNLTLDKVKQEAITRAKIFFGDDDTSRYSVEVDAEYVSVTADRATAKVTYEEPSKSINGVIVKDPRPAFMEQY